MPPTYTSLLENTASGAAKPKDHHFGIRMLFKLTFCAYYDDERSWSLIAK